MNEQEQTNITPQINPIPEEWNKKPKNNKTLIIILIILLVLCIIGGTFYYINTNITNKNNKNDTTTTTIDTSKTIENYTSTPIDILDKMKINNAEKKEDYIKIINGNEHKFTFYYYYEEAKIENLNGAYPDEDIVEEDGFNYILSIHEDDNLVGRYVIGFGLTKEEASNKQDYSKYRPNYSIDLITTIKDTVTKEEYVVYLIPECLNKVYDQRTGEFITSPTIRKENRNIIKTIETSDTLFGTNWPTDPQYGLTSELVYNNHGTYRIDNNKIYYVDKTECGKTTIKLSILAIKNGKPSITTIDNLEADGAGQC